MFSLSLIARIARYPTFSHVIYLLHSRAAAGVDQSTEEAKSIRHEREKS